MTITIKNINDIEKLKKYVSDNPKKPLCYVFYKNNMRFPNVYYVGFTDQIGIAKYHYLSNHHKMKSLITNLNNGFSIQIYTQYSEEGLIKLLKPTLNKQKGNCMKTYRNCCEGDLRSIGEIIGRNYEDKYIKKYKYIKCAYEKLLDELISKIYKKIILPYFKFVEILIHCKIDKRNLSYAIIHDKYKKNISWHLTDIELVCSCGKIYKKKGFLTKHIEKEKHIKKFIEIDTLNSSINKHIICAEILIELKKKDYLLTNFNQKKTDLCYYYQPTETYNAYVSFHNSNTQVNYKPSQLSLLPSFSNGLYTGLKFYIS